jgi:hypothetical protein
MELQKEQNLRNLLESVPHGFFVDSKWLGSQGISRQLATKYLKSGWLTREAHGLYRRPVQSSTEIAAEIPDWELLVLSMQVLMQYEVHVGGTTALRRRGHGHYVTMGADERVFLYGDKIPGWLKSVQTNAKFELRNRKLFSKPDASLDTGMKPNDGPHAQPPWRWSLTMSSPERAILEALNELPINESFNNIDMMFQGLVNLRPRRIMAALEACNSVQVKRLFFVFSDRHDHAWRKHIDETSVNLGSGDRSFVKGGKLHPKFRITVPSEFLPHPREEQDGQ